MVFTVLLQKKADVIVELVRTYYPEGCSIADLTYGTGGFWWRFYEDPLLKNHYKITGFDAEPSENSKNGDIVIKKNILTDTYDEFGPFDIVTFDPPYLIGRDSFDYSAAVKDGQLVAHTPLQYQGNRSWGKDRQKYVANQSVEDFNNRVKALNEKAPKMMKPDGRLIVNVMDPRWKGDLVPHHFNIWLLLTNFKLIDHLVSIRQGATTWVVKGHAQNLHGHYLVFRLKKGGAKQ